MTRDKRSQLSIEVVTFHFFGLDGGQVGISSDEKDTDLPVSVEGDQYHNRSHRS